MKFQGIPSGKLSFTAVPNLIFSELVPRLDDADELRVVLHIFYLLSHKKGSPRSVTDEELRADETLMRALNFKTQNLKRALDQAIADGALLAVEADDAAWYFFNTPEGRKAVAQIESGDLKIAASARVKHAPIEATPNIFKLYEQQIGALSPLIAEELKEAEQEFPPQVILDAFRIAAENNARSWRYVNKILMDWTRRNSSNEKTRRPASKRRPVVAGKLADVAKPK